MLIYIEKKIDIHKNKSYFCYKFFKEISNYKILKKIEIIKINHSFVVKFLKKFRIIRFLIKSKS